MLLYKNRIVITGGTGRFASSLKKVKTKYLIFYPSKSSLNILKENSILKYLKKKKPKYLIHLAGLSRPMSIHNYDIKKSIDLNIIGTANIVKICEKLKIKLIYFSTSYVYPGKRGGYKEIDPVLPINNYAWSKLGGEAAVHMYKNSLILRLSMVDYPFVHKKVLKGAYSSFMYNKNVSKIIPHILNIKGVLNIGGKKREIFNFVKSSTKKKILPISIKKIKNFPKDSSVDIKKLKKILKNSNLKISL